MIVKGRNRDTAWYAITDDDRLSPRSLDAVEHLSPRCLY
jgi:hypothetical protein